MCEVCKITLYTTIKTQAVLTILPKSLLIYTSMSSRFRAKNEINLTSHLEAFPRLHYQVKCERGNVCIIKTYIFCIIRSQWWWHFPPSRSLAQHLIMCTPLKHGELPATWRGCLLSMLEHPTHLPIYPLQPIMGRGYRRTTNEGISWDLHGWDLTSTWGRTPYPVWVQIGYWTYYNEGSGKKNSSLCLIALLLSQKTKKLCCLATSGL